MAQQDDMNGNVAGQRGRMGVETTEKRGGRWVACESCGCRADEAESPCRGKEEEGEGDHAVATLKGPATPSNLAFRARPRKI